MKYLFLGRQPVINLADETVAFFLRFHTQSNQEKLSQVNYIASISKVLHSFDIKRTFGTTKAWVSIDSQSLGNADLTLLPKESFIFYIIRMNKIDEAFYNNIDTLRELGFEFAVESDVASKIQEDRGDGYLNNFYCIVFDGKKSESFKTIVDLYNNLGIVCAIKNVKTKYIYNIYKSQGFNYFLGSYFKEAEPIKGHQLSASKLKFLELLAMLKSNTKTEDIVAAIKFSPDISMQLLKFINSANIKTTNYVESIFDAFNLMGRNKITSWVVLSLYSASETSVPQELMDTSMMRAHLMELLCDILDVPSLKDQAYLVGILSTSDAIFKVFIHTIIEEGNFSDAVSDALLKKSGDLSKILIIAKVIEEGEPKKLEIIAQKLNVRIEDFKEILEETYIFLNNTKKLFR